MLVRKFASVAYKINVPTACSSSIRFFSGGSKKKDIVPDEFYNESVEDDKEFFDIVTSLKKNNSLRSLPISNKPVKSWDQYVNSTPKAPIAKVGDALAVDHVESEMTNVIQKAIGMDESEVSVGKKEEEIYDATFDDTRGSAEIASHFADVGEINPYVPVSAFNYSIPDYTPVDEVSNNFLEEFIPNTAAEKYPMHNQGLRHCEGKKQRHGKSKELRCHMIDLDDLHYTDVTTLKRFVTDDGEIISKRITGLCAKCQRQVATTIKHARNMGMLPHLGQFVLRDGKPQYKPTSFHELVTYTTNSTAKHVNRIESKTIVV